MALFLWLAILACTTPDTVDDTSSGATADAGVTDGGTTTGERCREVISTYDEDTAPANSKAMEISQAAMASLGLASWTTTLDGSPYSELKVAPEWTGDLMIVNWIADGSSEAVYDCWDGPATRLRLAVGVEVGSRYARADIGGFMDSDGVRTWFTRARSESVRLSDSWEDLVGAAEEGAGHGDATTFLTISTTDGPEPVLTVGSVDDAWSQAWWSGVMTDGKVFPTSQVPD
ncbi:hypothetical protein L6R53_33270 [Myxococcota bacterium]|nr:hypothetical protein [Myxococcota bacterium]